MNNGFDLVDESMDPERKAFNDLVNEILVPDADQDMADSGSAEATDCSMLPTAATIGLQGIVVLGDIVGPLNAWGTCEPLASDDAAILQLAVQVPDATGAGVVPGLNEMMLLGDDTSRCQLGKSHRKLLALVRNAAFRDAWRRACKRAPESVCRAAKTVPAIVHDNSTRPAPN